MDDYLDRIARAVDPEAFSEEVTSLFARAANDEAELSPEALKWMPRIVAARQTASRVLAVEPTELMELAGEALISTHPDSTPRDIFRMMIYAERDMAQRRDAPGIELDWIEPEEYFYQPGF